MAFFVFLAVLAYLFIGVIILMVVSINGKKKRIWATVTALVLIPTWDVLLAFLVFIPSALFWSGDTIHEYVQTDSVYYDVYYKRKGVFQHRRRSFFRDGIKSVEMDVQEVYPESLVPEKGLYRFWLDDQDTVRFKKIDKISARYTIRLKPAWKMPKIPVEFSRMDIVDREQNKVIASGKEVGVEYLCFMAIPFFNWLDWYDQKFYVSSYRKVFRFDRKVINVKPDKQR